MVEYFKAQKITGHDLIPNIILTEAGSVLNIIFVIYFIILFEFYPSKFREIEQYEIKINNYINSHYEYLISKQATPGSDKANLPTAKQKIHSMLMRQDVQNLTFSEIDCEVSNGINIFTILTVFTPCSVKHLGLVGGDIKPADYLRQFEKPEDDILISFAKYLLINIKELKKNKYDYKLWDLFSMAKTIL